MERFGEDQINIIKQTYQDKFEVKKEINFFLRFLKFIVAIFF